MVSMHGSSRSACVCILDRQVLSSSQKQAVVRMDAVNVRRRGSDCVFRGRDQVISADEFHVRIPHREPALVLT